MTAAIRVENLSKRFRLGARSLGHSTIRDAFAEGLKAWRRREREHQEWMWALRDVNFNVSKGEVVGIIGNNGAGKSTLLKIISRIIGPTSGTIALSGRVGSLLEVGTGFHPELTGRENILLSGAILGMDRAEIRRKFDDIIGFSEIEKFINTPVKHYSSGMYLRLAFSVAIHLDPEILLMDEVLAVGDAPFQLKCIDKIQEIRAKGRTILFVSHNMSTITRLCERAVLLEKGRVVADGPASDVVSSYLSDRGIVADRVWHGESNGNVRLVRVRIRDEAGRTVPVFDIRQPVGFEITYDVRDAGRVLVPGFHVKNSQALCLFVLQDVNTGWGRRPRPAGRYTSTVWVPGNFFTEGAFRLDVGVNSHFPATVSHILERDVVGFQVIDEGGGGPSARGDYVGPLPGVIRPLMKWTTEPNPTTLND